MNTHSPSNLLFLKSFIANPLGVSSVIPTSRVAARRIASMVDGSRRRIVAEYGPGTGAVTRELLQPGKLTEDSLLILIEQEPELAEALQASIHDPRVRVFQDSAERVRSILSDCGEERADYVLTSIPLSVMKEPVRQTVLHETQEILNEDGTLIVFLVRLKTRQYVEEFFSSVHTNWEPRNIPPLFIFQAHKNNAQYADKSARKNARSSTGLRVDEE